MWFRSKNKRELFSIEFDDIWIEKLPSSKWHIVCRKYNELEDVSLYVLENEEQSMQVLNDIQKCILNDKKVYELPFYSKQDTIFVIDEIKNKIENLEKENKQLLQENNELKQKVANVDKLED